MHISRLVIILLTLSGCLFTTSASALHPEERAEHENLHRRIAELEAEQATEAAEGDWAPGFSWLNEYVQMHGLLEVEGHYSHPEGGDGQSDINLATAELSIEASLNETVGGHVTLLYEEDEEGGDDIDLDEAVISLKFPDSLFDQSTFLHAGRMYLPFGMFNSSMISDPLTLELGETRNTSLLLAAEGDRWAARVAVFNGDVDKVGDNDMIDSWVASFELSPHETVTFGASYLSDLAESGADMIQDQDFYQGSAAAVSTFVSANLEPFSIEAEYLGAIEDFDESMAAVDTDLTGKRPSAWNFELAWLATERLQLAARYEAARDYQDDVRRYGVTVSYGLQKNVLVALEYLHADAKGAGNDPEHQATVQLAIEF